MKKSFTEMHGQELLASEKEKIEHLDSIIFDVETPMLIHVHYKDVCIGRLIMKCGGFEWEPTKDTLAIDISIRNLNPKK